MSIRSSALIDVARSNRSGRQALLHAHGRRGLVSGSVGTRAEAGVSLPVLDAMAHTLSADVDLEGCFLVASVHLLHDTDAVLRKLEGWGLDPRRAIVFGKPYSTNLRVVAGLLERGYTVHSSSYLMDERIPLGRALEAAALESLTATVERWAKEGGGRKILLADDGGKLIRIAHDHFRELAGVFSSVEHTSRGIFELERTDLCMPVVNVARSWAKLNVESTYIGESVDVQLERRVGRLDPNTTALVVGYGAIGKAVAICLRRRGMEVLVHDPALKDSAGEPYERLLARADLVLGCSGRTTLDEVHWPYLKSGAVLVSCSSLDLEFAAWKIRAAPRPAELVVVRDDLDLEFGSLGGRQMFLGDPDDPSHYWYCARLAGREVNLLNGGCPINFTGAAVSMPHTRSDLTVSLLLSGIAQASNEQRIGLVPLGDAAQELLVGMHLRAVG
ncbi:NAD(P)-dependent oxidoreductase [Sorangium sp. So ce136]|uniref:NAD(P)-dependent oxidoreductase n=1 Tax=Sorangium sp. So ce136 TaxID=3133284 RepID=UPI003F0DCB23